MVRVADAHMHDASKNDQNFYVSIINHNKVFS